MHRNCFLIFPPVWVYQNHCQWMSLHTQERLLSVQRSMSSIGDGLSQWWHNRLNKDSVHLSQSSWKRSWRYFQIFKLWINDQSLEPTGDSHYWGTARGPAAGSIQDHGCNAHPQGILEYEKMDANECQPCPKNSRPVSNASIKLKYMKAILSCIHAVPLTWCKGSIVIMASWLYEMMQNSQNECNTACNDYQMSVGQT